MTVAPVGGAASAFVSSSECRRWRCGAAATSRRHGNAPLRGRCSMPDLVRQFDSAPEITAAAQRLREQALARELTPTQVIKILERWGEALRGPAVDAIPGVPFLKLWLRRGTLESIVVRELGPEGLRGEWRAEGSARLRAFPLGGVGRWPAGNVEIQPLLSMSCALLAGNACLVRVPSGLLVQTRTLIDRLSDVADGGVLLER